MEMEDVRVFLIFYLHFIFDEIDNTAVTWEKMVKVLLLRYKIVLLKSISIE